MKVYDNYEISPCRRYEEPDSPGKFYFEVCDPDEADVWTLYGHINGEGVQAVGDFDTREHAEEVYARITGLPFAGSYKADAHLRVMHAGPRLLAALQALLPEIENEIDQRKHSGNDEYWESLEALAHAAHVAVAEATGRSA